MPKEKSWIEDDIPELEEELDVAIGFTSELGGPSEDDSEPTIGHNGGPSLTEAEMQARIAAISKLSTADILRLTHKKMLEGLLLKVELGEATHQELAILRNLLKDNGMILGVPPVDPAGNTAPPQASLPVFDKPDWEEDE